MRSKKPKGFKAFDELARKLVQVPPSEVNEDTECPRCEGTGRYQRAPWDKDKPCSICNGTGKIGPDGMGKKK